MNNGLIPEGDYAAKATSAVLAQMRGGTEYIELKLTITQPGECQGRVIVKECWLTDKAWEYAIKDLRTCGWKGTDVRDIKVTEDVSITVEHEVETDRDGKVKTGPDNTPRKRARVRWINSLRSKPVSAEKATNLVDKFKARFEEWDAKQDELPF